jgi:(1->4)-alpha-D-glucan 1-alpha-D-glucosylmutase
MRVPVATYRVQFNDEFRFEHATEIVPHLHRLGISHLYASPIWAAREGSTHGYDVVDPNRLNPVLGTRDDFDALVQALRSREMGLIVDIVPNHMAASPENAWWMDVLENGALSPYASYFGINWGAVRQSHGEKIFLPILGAPYGATLEKGEIQLVYKDDAFFVCYYERRLPVAVRTYGDILGRHAHRLSDVAEFTSLLEALTRLRELTGGALYREQDQIRKRLAKMYRHDPRIREHVDGNIIEFNGTAGNAAAFDPLDALLQQQAYRLAYWHVATERINYRRFFDVSDLIGMRIEDPEVFRASHALIFDLVNSGMVDGLRIDHIDGLADPKGYLDRLPADATYIVAEKILVGDERLPRDWRLHGTTGYDFLGYMNALFVDPEGLEQIDRFYAQHTGRTGSLTDVEYQRKLLVINSLFAGEMADLGANLERLAEHDRYARDLSPRDLARGLKEITACMPVYRTYTRSYEVSERDRPYLQFACDEARRRCSEVGAFAYDFITRVLHLQFHSGMSEESKMHWLRFVRRWQQLSGPIMAKGVEDSTFYVYNRLVSLNEVGGLSRPCTAQEFHEFLAERQQLWPGTMNASSTHDTKRSEDVRARINVISELPGEWSRLVGRWSRWLAPYLRSVDRNEEYFYLQNLIGAWPLFPHEADSFRDRLKTYSTKAAREAREHTDWLAPNEQHEQDLRSFIDALFENEQFLSSFLGLQQKISFYGAVNSLSQVLLKIAAPGCPDFYRGTISWDFSLVDPDNRRPAPFPSLTDFSESAHSLLDHWHDGHVKVYLTERALAFRAANADLFRDGEYIPLLPAGKRAEHVFAFIRRLGDRWAIIAVPRLVSKLSTVLRFPTGMTAWRDTQLTMPGGAPARWKNVITGGRLSVRDAALPVHRVLDQFPVALLVSK